MIRKRALEIYLAKSQMIIFPQRRNARQTLLVAVLKSLSQGMIIKYKQKGELGHACGGVLGAMARIAPARPHLRGIGPSESCGD
jgi:hypothetical protein